MFDPISDGKKTAKELLLEAFIRIAAQSNYSEHTVPDFSVTAPNVSSFGDLSTNAPIVFAQILGLSPELSASLLAKSFSEKEDDIFCNILSSTPGFLGFHFSSSKLLSYADLLMHDDGEYVGSANPTVFLWGRNDNCSPEYTPEEFRTLSVFNSLRNILKASGADPIVNPLSDDPNDSDVRTIAVFSEKEWDQNPKLKTFGENIEKVVVQTWKTTLSTVKPDPSIGFLLCLTRPGRPSFMPDELPFKQTKENPSYYLKYIYSWIGNMLYGLSRRYSMPECFPAGYEPDDSERELILSCLRFPSCINTALTSLDPSVPARYLMDLALQYERFYRSFRLEVRDDTEQTLFRMRLSFLVRSTLARGMDLFDMEHRDEL